MRNETTTRTIKPGKLTLAEHLSCKQEIVGSIPTPGSNFLNMPYANATTLVGCEWPYNPSNVFVHDPENPQWVIESVRLPYPSIRP